MGCLNGGVVPEDQRFGYLSLERQLRNLGINVPWDVFFFFIISRNNFINVWLPAGMLCLRRFSPDHALPQANHPLHDCYGIIPQTIRLPTHITHGRSSLRCGLLLGKQEQSPQKNTEIRQPPIRHCGWVRASKKRGDSGCPETSDAESLIQRILAEEEAEHREAELQPPIRLFAILKRNKAERIGDLWQLTIIWELFCIAHNFIFSFRNCNDVPY